MTTYMLTTTDNPYDPFTQFRDWFAYDMEAGYNTPSFLARIVNSSEDMSEPDQEIALQNAIDEVVNENVLGLYVKIDRTGRRSM